MKKNKYAAALAALLLVGALAGCTGKDAAAEVSSSAKGDEAGVSLANADAAQNEGKRLEGASSSAAGAAPGGDFETTVVNTGAYEFEIPANWMEVEENSEPDGNPALYFFVPKDANMEKPTSNLVAEIHPATTFTNDKAQFATEESQNSFWKYAEATLLAGVENPKNVEYSAIELEDRYLYVVEFDRDAGGEVVHQICYYAMGFDVPIVVYATDYGNDIEPEVRAAAQRVAASFRFA